MGERKQRPAENWLLPVGGRTVRVVAEGFGEKCLDYRLPESWGGRVQLGCRLRVPLGRGETLGTVVDFPEHAEVEELREARELVDETPLIPANLVRLARWMADYYCCALPLAVRAMLPEPVRSRKDGYLNQMWVEAVGMEPAQAKALLGKAAAQWRVWQALGREEGQWMSVVCRELRTTPKVLRTLETKGLVRLGERRRERLLWSGEAPVESVHVLNADQEQALAAWREEQATPAPRPVLLQGVTGSGKTEVYLRALEEVRQVGRQGLVLVPEIALTPQTVERFRARFEPLGVRVAVLHSHLGAGERHDQWQAIRRGDAEIVIGARSAIFAPLERLGLIIVDEEHETGYKQEEAPRYQARDAAVMRARLEGATVLLGSATPSAESRYHAQTGKYRHARLTCRVGERALPVVHLVDLRKERGAGDPWFGPTLREAVRQRLERGEQSLLFLNRRGFATSVQCPNCGRIEECPSCSIPLTYHRTTNLLRCHLCDHQGEPAERCPGCGHGPLKYGGSGTQRIEASVEKWFPGARWMRVDSDSMARKGSLERVLGAFERGELDLLIGTQMIAKGLHFPKVTCVGVINVDTALQMPDFRAAERVFQLLTQVAGRAGRGCEPGEVFLQTRLPTHPAVQFARHHDVEGYLEHELDYRKAHGYPPYRRAALVTFRGHSEEKVKFCAEQAAQRLRECAPEAEVSPAAPAHIARLRTEYRYQVFLLTGRMSELSRHLRREILEAVWPEGVRAAVDVDPVNLL